MHKQTQHSFTARTGLQHTLITSEHDICQRGNYINWVISVKEEISNGQVSSAGLPFNGRVLNPHLEVTIGQQEAHDNVWAEEFYSVQPFLDAAQLVAQVLPAKTLPRQTDLPPDRLVEILTAKKSSLFQFCTQSGKSKLGQ